jgi:hypothetical protein
MTVAPADDPLHEQAWAWILNELDLALENVPPRDPDMLKAVTETVESLKKIQKNYFVTNLLKGM